MSNMFKPVKAKSVSEYLKLLPSERKKDVEFLHKFIQKISPKFKSHFAYNMLGYGSFKYVNYKKQTLDWPIVALASQKNYISVYVCALDKGQYIAEKHRKELGKVSVGRSCVRLKKISDINLKTLKTVLIQATKNPGLVKS